MKTTLAFAVAILLAGSAQAQTKLQTLKVADGTVSVCKSEHDVVSRRNRLGAYRAKALTAEMDGENIQLKVALSFLKCSNSRGQVGFVSTSPYESTTFANPILGNADHKSKVTVSDVRLKGYKDGVYKLIVDQEVNDEGIQIVSVEVPVKDIVSEGTYENFNANLDLFVSKKVRFQSLEDASKVFDDVSNFGKFRVHLKVETDEAGNQKASIL